VFTNSTTVTLSENYQGVTDGNVTAYSIASYKVGATLSRGSRPTIMQPPTLATLQLLQVDVPVPPAPSVPQVVPIPQDAGIISVLTTVVATTGPQSESLNGRVTFSDKLDSSSLEHMSQITSQVGIPFQLVLHQ